MKKLFFPSTKFSAKSRGFYSVALLAAIVCLAVVRQAATTPPLLIFDLNDRTETGPSFGTAVVLDNNPIDPAICPLTCNLVGYGDFEAFPTGKNTYYPNFTSPYNSQIIITSGNSGINLNSVDVQTDGNNQYARWISLSNGYHENLLVPICQEIPPGCDITVSFDACMAIDQPPGQPVMLGVWALSQLPIPMELPNTTVCNGLLLDNSGNTIGTCIGEVQLPDDCGSSINFTSFSVSGSFTQAVTHIWFFDNSSLNNLDINVFMDNISVTNSCQNHVDVTPIVLEACVDGQAVIDLEVCLNGTLNTPATVTLTPDLSGISGISLSAVNPDFPNGVATITGLLPGQCSTPTLFLDIDAGVPPGVPVTIPAGVSVSGACAQSPDIEITLVPEYCDSLQCDCPPGSIVIGSPGVETLLSDLVTATILPASQPFNVPFNLTIRGTLVMDANVVTGTPTGLYVFTPYSDICMDAGAEIRIPPNNTLSIFDSHIRGCEKRWESITVESAATLNLVGDGLGLIEDAQYAVHPRNKSTVNIQRTSFNKNYVALYFNDPLGEFTLQPFSGNSMYCTANLLPHYNGQDPNDGPWSFAGIYTKGQDAMSIGVAGAAVNRFNSLRNGIITEDCNLTLRNSRFSNIQRLDYATSGNGVLATGTGHNFIEDGSCPGINTVFFDDCYTGISLRGMNARVHNNEMNNVAYGVYVQKSPNRDVEICGNTINCTNRGICLWFNDPAQRIQVNNNAIHVTAPVPNIRAAAIFVRENGATQPNAHIESHYNIAIFNAGAGISLNGCNGYQIEQNFITAGQPPLGTMSYAGITLWNSPGNFLGCNSVDGDYENNPNGGISGPFGIRARASTNIEYDCNDVQDTYLGVQFDMPCGNTDFHTTSFLNHRYGLHYTTTAVTGAQPMGGNDPLHGNRWNGAWGGANAVGARHESTLPDFVNESRYFVPSIPAPWGPENPESVSPNWFATAITQELSCGITCNVWLTEDTTITELDERIAQGLVDPGVYTEPMQWMLERDLYRKLYGNPELVVPNTVFDTFYTDKSATSIGRFIAVETAIHALFELDSNTAGQLQDYYEQMAEQMERTTAMDSLLQTLSGQDSLDLLAQREVVFDVIDSLSQLNSALVDSILQARSAAANAVIAQNNAIVTTDIWEQNEKTVNHIFLNTVVKSIAPNGTQLSLLRSVAAQCPYEGGTAVFRARALLDAWTEDVFDDEVLCADGGQQGLMLPPAGNQSVSTGIRMFPNPARDRVMLSMEDGLESDAVLSVYNLYGQLASSYYLSEGDASFSFSTEGLPQGIYLVRIQQGGSTAFSSKLVISR
jgi:Secretion system C-terminal sorting domain